MFENIDPEHTWILRNTAQKVGKIVNSLIEQSLKEVAPGSAAVSTPYFLPPAVTLTSSTEHIHYFGVYCQKHALPDPAKGVLRLLVQAFCIWEAN